MSNRVTPSDLLEIIKGNNGNRVNVKADTLFRECGIDPSKEEHRAATWNISQAAATLVREGYLDLDTSSGQRIYWMK